MSYRNRMGTDVMRVLAEQKSDINQPHTFDFYFYFKDEITARNAADKLRDTGFETVVCLGADNLNWLCLSTKDIIPSEQALNSLGEDLEDLALKYQGEFDGWECATAKDS
jgi:hypothetical protein